MNAASIDIIAAITAATSIVVSFGVVVGYYTQKMKDAEERGRLMNRVEQTEKSLTSCTDRLVLVEDSHNRNAQSLAKQEAAIDYIKQKLDEMVKWHAELANAMRDISQRMPR